MRLRDTAGDAFVLGVRATGLTRLATTFGTTTNAKADGPVAVDGVTGAVTGRLAADGAAPDMTADLTAGTIRSAAGSAVALAYESTTGLALGATSFQATATGLAPDTTIALGGATTGAEITTDKAVALKLALAGPGSTATLPADGTSSTLDLEATAATMTLRARLADFRRVHIEPQTGTLGGTFTASRPLELTAKVAGAQLQATVTDAPSELTLTAGPSRVAWTASAAADQLVVARSGPGGRALSAGVRGVPTEFTTTLADTGTQFASPAPGAAVRRAPRTAGRSRPRRRPRSAPARHVHGRSRAARSCRSRARPRAPARRRSTARDPCGCAPRRARSARSLKRASPIDGPCVKPAGTIS